MRRVALGSKMPESREENEESGSKGTRTKEAILEKLQRELEKEQEQAADVTREFFVINQEKKSKKIMLETKQSYKHLDRLNAWEPANDEMAEDDKPTEKKNKANVQSMNPLNVLRELVSLKKRRLKVDGFNLDLTYITNHVVALGYPASGVEAAVRNRRKDVIRFFKLRHGNNVKIYNLCIEESKQYDQSEIPDFGLGKY